MATVELEVTSGSKPNWKSPLKKLVGFFQRSRDSWKEKYMTTKQEYKLMGNQLRAVTKSRARWKQMAEQAQRQVRELQAELKQYKKSSV